MYGIQVWSFNAALSKTTMGQNVTQCTNKTNFVHSMQATVVEGG